MGRYGKSIGLEGNRWQRNLRNTEMKGTIRQLQGKRKKGVEYLLMGMSQFRCPEVFCGAKKAPKKALQWTIGQRSSPEQLRVPMEEGRVGGYNIMEANGSIWIEQKLEDPDRTRRQVEGRLWGAPKIPMECS